MNKKLLVFGLMGVFAVALATAAYLVSSFVITVDVTEPFNDIEYVIVGNAGEWDGTGCDVASGWIPIADVDVAGINAGESRNVCIRFNNDAEADINYTVSSKVLNVNEDVKAKCEAAFPVVELTGKALKSSPTNVGYDFKVAEDAPVVDDCRIQIEVSRG